LGVEFIYRGIVEYGDPGLIVVFEVSPEKMVRDAAALGWDLSELEQSDQLKIIFTTRDNRLKGWRKGGKPTLPRPKGTIIHATTCLRVLAGHPVLSPTASDRKVGRNKDRTLA
jgi:KaiC/GvpD/RAD55 family RecA-like ATPase